MLNNSVRHYIKKSWQESVITSPKETDFSFALPYPYVPPCKDGVFKTLIYWDAYFTNIGLITDGYETLALNNIMNFIHVIKLYGFVPNGLSRSFLNRSQPPLLAWMVESYYRHTQDIDWLKSVLPYVEKEYDFWMRERVSKNGLNIYGNNASAKELLDFSAYVINRLQLKEKPSESLGYSYLAEAESGWDFTPRFNGKCDEYNPVDLNAIIYHNELFLAEALETIGSIEKASHYEKYAKLRKMRMTMYLSSADGIYRDYNWATHTLSHLTTAASFLPSLVGIHIPGKAVHETLLKKLEYNNGLCAIEKTNGKQTYQWDFPNMWPPLVYFCVKSLEIAGLHESALRVAKKYIKTVNADYLVTNKLWEKYDVQTGSKSQHNEYEITEMLGWTAGVYVYLDEMLKKRI